MEIARATTKSLPFWREFWILFGAGLAASAALAAISGLPTTPIAMFLYLKGNPQGPALLVIAAAETMTELSLTVGLGLLAAHSVGLGAPLLEKYLQGQPVPYLRTLLIPAVLIGVSIGVLGTAPSLPIFHPNRQLIRRQTDELLSSAAKTKIYQFVERTAGRRLTNLNLGPYYLSGAVSGELGSRLFLLSGVAWILVRVSRAKPARLPPSLAVGRHHSGASFGGSALSCLALHIPAAVLGRRRRNPGRRPTLAGHDPFASGIDSGWYWTRVALRTTRP